MGCVKDIPPDGACAWQETHDVIKLCRGTCVHSMVSCVWRMCGECAVRCVALTGVPPAQDGGADGAVLLSRHEVLL